jgi:hypothetical protein
MNNNLNEDIIKKNIFMKSMLFLLLVTLISYSYFSDINVNLKKIIFIISCTALLLFTFYDFIYNYYFLKDKKISHILHFIFRFFITIIFIMLYIITYYNINLY